MRKIEGLNCVKKIRKTWTLGFVQAINLVGIDLDEARVGDIAVEVAHCRQSVCCVISDPLFLVTILHF